MFGYFRREKFPILGQVTHPYENAHEYLTARFDVRQKGSLVAIRKQLRWHAALSGLCLLGGCAVTILGAGSDFAASLESWEYGCVLPETRVVKRLLGVGCFVFAGGVIWHGAKTCRMQQLLAQNRRATPLPFTLTHLQNPILRNPDNEWFLVSTLRKPILRHEQI